MTARWCTHGCAIPHREDCRTCFGFGVYVVTLERRRTLVPVVASEAHGDTAPRGTVYVCPECDGGRQNVPWARGTDVAPPLAHDEGAPPA